MCWPPEDPQNMHNDNRAIPSSYNNCTIPFPYPNHTIPFPYHQPYHTNPIPQLYHTILMPSIQQCTRHAPLPHSDHTLYLIPLIFPRHVYHDDVVVWDGESVGKQNTLGLRPCKDLVIIWRCASLRLFGGALAFCCLKVAFHCCYLQVTLSCCYLEVTLSCCYLQVY